MDFNGNGRGTPPVATARISLASMMRNLPVDASAKKYSNDTRMDSSEQTMTHNMLKMQDTTSLAGKHTYRPEFAGKLLVPWE